MLNFRPQFLVVLRRLERSVWARLLGLGAAVLASREPSAVAAPESKVASISSVSRSRSAPAPSGLESIAVPTALSVLPAPEDAAAVPLWQRPGRKIAYVSLGALLPPGRSWQTLEANSEQRQPLHFLPLFEPHC